MTGLDYDGLVFLGEIMAGMIEITGGRLPRLSEDLFEGLSLTRGENVDD